MGIVQSGILGGWYGKVGTVVGSYWKGIPLLREWKRKISNPSTDGQKLVRSKFALLGAMSGAFTPAINIGLKGRADKVKSTQQGEFVKANWDALEGDSAAALTVNYDELELSNGNFTGVEFGAPNFTNPLEVAVPITGKNLDAPGANAADPIVVAAYCPDMHQGVTSAGVVTRNDNSVTLHVPTTWQGMNVHVYGFVMPSLGAKNRDNASPTAYIGFGNIS